MSKAESLISIRQGELRFANRTLWSKLDMDVAAGEFVAIVGPNGSGKTSLLKVLLGLQPMTAGTVTVAGKPPQRGSNTVGYVPQQRGFDRDLPLRARDLVGLGLDGHRWGLIWPSKARARKIDEALASVGAESYASKPVGMLSGGEQQRLRMAQALLSRPAVLLCDEPLLSLDPHHQRAITELVDRSRKRDNMAVLFVTHELNPVLPLVDRVLYLVDARWMIGTPDEVMTSESLSKLYQTPVDVLRVKDRLVVVGAPDSSHGDGGGHHHHIDEYSAQ
jgi:zinc/manganese transport system ATP-binding protein